MSVTFRVEMFIVAIVFFIIVVKLVNRNIFLLGNAAIWILISFLLLIFSLFPKIPINLAHFFGFDTPSNFLMFGAIIVLLIFSFYSTVAVSKQRNQLIKLIQEISILKKENKKE